MKIVGSIAAEDYIGRFFTNYNLHMQENNSVLETLVDNYCDHKIQISI